MAYQRVEVITNLTGVNYSTLEEFKTFVYWAGLDRQDIIDMMMAKCVELGASSEVIDTIEQHVANPDTVEEFDVAAQTMTRTRTYPDKFTHDTIIEWSEITWPTFQNEPRYSLELISEGEI